MVLCGAENENSSPQDWLLRTRTTVSHIQRCRVRKSFLIDNLQEHGIMVLRGAENENSSPQDWLLRTRTTVSHIQRCRVSTVKPV